MRTNATPRRRDPLFVAFGMEPRKLTHEEAIAATVDERIGSVWHYVCRKANKFSMTLSHRERANFDTEDVLGEVYIELRMKDSRWEPSRGRYITFATEIASRCMSNIRDRARTVETPSNGSWRLSQYQAAQDRGDLTEKQAKTFADVKRTASGYNSIETSGRHDGGFSWAEPGTTDDSVEGREHDRLVRDAITWGILALTAFEAFVIGQYNGLNGKESKTLAQIAEQTGKPLHEVKRAKDSAVAKIRERLVSMGHPAVASEN